MCSWNYRFSIRLKKGSIVTKLVALEESKGKWCWRKAFGLKSPHVYNPDTEIAPGIARPAYVLVGMMAAAVLKDFKRISQCGFCNEDVFKRWFGEAEHVPSFLKDGDNSVVSRYAREKRYCFALVKWSGTVGGKEFVCVFMHNNDKIERSLIALDGERVSVFEEIDKALLLESCLKAHNLQQQAVAKDLENQKHQQATDLIENIFKTNEGEEEIILWS